MKKYRGVLTVALFIVVYMVGRAFEIFPDYFFLIVVFTALLTLSDWLTKQGKPSC